ncbi:MFS transporter, FHS family, L-fucose permease [Granulicella rosea]|uniref:MFS transporter, FHS family, L-fucose permease n=1 Tax=Granulicella rosea TaxID=474952 RepID=A0A239M3L1_9BACT|nr:sugar MFS transporter [Granulicella rosea]SNT37181.1 MFS transporter, FHS family, L-fucose permease [Granulicella rosea]
MAGGTSSSTSTTLANTEAPQGSYAVPLTLMVSLFFGIGFITTMNDVLVAHFKDLFHLTNFLALLVQSAFFGAYFVMSAPAGRVVSRIGYQSGIVVSLATIAFGLLLFLPASRLILYPLFLFALFVIGSGLALLQVAINPYVGALGPPETAASRLNLCGFLNSLAGTLAPKVGAMFIFIAAGATAAQLAHSVQAPYMVLAAAAFLMAILTRFVHLPVLIATEDKAAVKTGSAWDFRNLRFGAVGIFTYVGAEVALGSIIINFLGQPSMGGLSHAEATHYVSLYWGGAMVGRLIGFFALQRVRAPRALAFVCVLAILCMAAAIFGHGPVAMWAVVSCGLFNSVMWPCIFPMSLEGLGRHTSQGSGILVTMIVGGALIPPLQGVLADAFGYQRSFAIVLLCYVYLLYFALDGHKQTVASIATLPPPEVV